MAPQLLCNVCEVVYWLCSCFHLRKVVGLIPRKWACLCVEFAWSPQSMKVMTESLLRLINYSELATSGIVGL